MDDPETYLAFGSLVAAVGLALIVFHVKARRSHASDTSLTERDRRFYNRQYSRRMQTSALTITLGALISLCGYIRNFEELPIFASFYVIGLLLLSVWLILLALGDALASRMYASQLERHTRREGKSLQQALAEVREAHGLDPQE